MTNDFLFEANNYRDYLVSQAERHGHGFKSKIAESTGCQSPYISRVLRGIADLSLEQAEKLNQLMAHSEIESHYFLMLVQKGRAGTPALRAYFSQQLKLLKDKHFNIKERLKEKSKITKEDRYTYYSSWIYSAAHVMSSIPHFQSLANMSKGLGESKSKTLSVLMFLESIGLVETKEGRYIISSGNIHLGRDDINIIKHHTNWRVKALSAIEKSDSENLHYSLVMSISDKDSEKIKAMLIRCIQEINELLPQSLEESAKAICLDVFKL